MRVCVALTQASERLEVVVDRAGPTTRGDSLGVAAAMSLVCMALKRRPKPGVVVTGALSLTGRVLDVGGLAGKLQGCMREGSQTLLVPSSTLQHLDAASLPTEELRQYAGRALRGYSTLLEALELAILGTYVSNNS